MQTGSAVFCNEQGIDTISAASTIACYAEITQKRLSGEKIISLLEDICKNQGEGAALAQGSYRFAKEHGKPELSFSVKGLELPAYDPRGAYGMALQGYRYQDILKYYYQGINIIKKY